MFWFLLIFFQLHGCSAYALLILNLFAINFINLRNTDCLTQTVWSLVTSTGPR